MSPVRLSLLGPAGEVACAFFGRGADPRPRPAALLPLLDGPAPPGAALPPLVTMTQIHSARWLIVERPAGDHAVAGEGDAMATRERGLALGVATADCVPLVAADPEAGVLAVVHAGWRGTLDGVLEAALAAMRERLGARPDRIVVAAGPAAGPCCYRVGPQVVERFERERRREAERVVVRRGGAAFLDLIEANRLQAVAAGVRAEGFQANAPCTICSPELFHSYRRDGAAAGRNWLLALLRPRARAGAPGRALMGRESTRARTRTGS